MNVYFSNVYCDPLTLDKRAEYERNRRLAYVNIQITNSANYLNPSFLVTQEFAGTYNYMYIPEWNRFYFIGKPTVIDGTRSVIPCECDVLTSHADQLLNLTAYVTRTENSRNKFLNDTEFNAQTTRHNTIVQFNRSPFTVNFSTDQCYLLSVIGGVDNS